MSSIELDRYLDDKQQEFEQILRTQYWDKLQPFYKLMEDEGWGRYVPEISQLMSDEDVVQYRKWDTSVNGDTETQML